MVKKKQYDTIYAIGDIHGMYGELVALENMIRNDIENLNRPSNCAIVFLGDYIDRGPASRQCVDHLMSTKNRIPGVRYIFLRGNHEELMLDYYTKDDQGLWFANGGEETLMSYKRGEMLKRHQVWLARRPLYYQNGGYFFVHAGVDPANDLESQDATAMLWIREKFLNNDGEYYYLGDPVKIVHGHSPVAEPEILPNRICVDTGAYYSGILTAGVFENDNIRFLSVRPAG